MKRVLVTGASGFVGVTLCELLARSGYIVRAALRTDRRMPESVSEKAVIGDIATPCDLAAALDGVDAVIHAAARTHVLDDSPVNTERYMQINARGTLHLAEAAAQAGVRRFVYLSSIKVNGEEADRGYRPDDSPCPRNAYGMSKWLGEKYLQEVAARTGMEDAIVRPPLVYGAGVGANFLRLMRWVDRERPLPFRSVHNRRSFVSVWNLGDLVIRVLMHPAASRRVWFVSDGDDLSTADLIQCLGTAMGRRVRLLPVPVVALRAAAAVTGKAAAIERLCGSLFVDIAETRRYLHWTPPVSVAVGLARTVEWYSLLR